MITFHIPSMETMFSNPSTSPAFTIHWGETAAANQLRATASTRLHCTGLISVPVHVDFKVDSVIPNVNSLVLIRHLHPWSTKANLSFAAKRLQMVSVARSQTKTLRMCVVMRPNRGIGIFYWAKVSALNPEAVMRWRNDLRMNLSWTPEVNAKQQWSTDLSILRYQRRKQIQNPSQLFLTVEK